MDATQTADPVQPVISVNETDATATIDNNSSSVIGEIGSLGERTSTPTSEDGLPQ